MELLINSNSNSWEILLTIAIAIVPKMSIAIVISILLISSASNVIECFGRLVNNEKEPFDQNQWTPAGGDGHM